MDEYATDIVGAEAERLAEKYYIPDIKRVLAIVQRTAADAYGRRFYNNASISMHDGFGFTPSLHEALTFLPPDKALPLFETTDLDALASKVFYFEYLVDGEAPFYTHEELADLIKQFIVYLKENGSSLLSIGYPAKSFEKSHWLYEKLSRLYPVKIPSRAHKKSRFHQRFDGILAEKDDHGNFIFDYSWTKESVYPITETLGQLFANSFKPFEQPQNCPYDEASLIQGLADKDVEHIYDYRSRIFNLKIDILELAHEYLCQKKNKDGFWDDCMDKISQRLTKDAIDQFIKIENAYSRLFVSNISSEFLITYLNPITAGQPDLETGGIDNIFGFIFFIETELSIGQMHKVRGELLELTGGQIPDFYYQLFLSPAFAGIDRAIERSVSDSVKTAEFEEIFNDRLKADSEKKLKMRLEVPSKNYNTVRKFLEFVETGQINCFFGTAPSVPVLMGKKITPIALPPGTKWKDIAIRFTDEHTVQVKCKGKAVSSDYIRMGFEDTRGRRPNKQWELLRSLSHRHGELAWEDSALSKSASIRKTEQDFGYEFDEDGPASQNRGFSIFKAPDKTKKTKQLLSLALKTVFQIDSDPFFPYEEVKAYKIRIKLIP